MTNAVPAINAMPATVRATHALGSTSTIGSVMIGKT
jgi:hypothetical protein